MNRGITRLLLATAVTAVATAVYVRAEGFTFVLGWIALIPWLAALDEVRSVRRALVAGLLMSEGFALAVFFWFPGAIQDYTGGSLALTWLILLVIAPLLEPQFVLFAVARTAAQCAGSRRWLAALAGAGIYVGTEWLLPKLFADTFGHPQFASRQIRQAADLFGAHGLTFVLVLANEGLLVAWRRRSRASAVPALAVAAVIVALWLYGEMRLRQIEALETGEESLAVGIVQGDLSHYANMAAEMGTYDAVRLILDRQFELSAGLLGRGRLDLLLWPETVYPTTFGSPKSGDGAGFDREISSFVAAQRVPLLFGSYDVDDGAEFNAAFLVHPDAGDAPRYQVYRKAFLFPLTEAVPAWIDSTTLRSWMPWLGTWKAGAGARVLDLPRGGEQPVRLAPLICYDALEPSLPIEAVRQGAEVLVTLSNDSWSAQGSGIPHLILVLSAFRSIETRRPQVRATNTGVSAFVSPSGELSDVIGVHEKGVRARRVHPVRGAETLMLAWGDWFPPFALALGSSMLGLGLLRRRALVRGEPPQPPRKRRAKSAGTPPK